LSTDQIRSFISIDLEDGRVLSEIDSVMSTLLSLGGDLKAVERENIHLTLKFLGNVDSAKIDDVKSALSKVRFSPFQLEIKGAGAFPSLGRMNVIWVGLGEGWTQVQGLASNGSLGVSAPTLLSSGSGRVDGETRLRTFFDAWRRRALEPSPQKGYV